LIILGGATLKPPLGRYFAKPAMIAPKLRAMAGVHSLKE
jgi:hypothetical protein